MSPRTDRPTSSPSPGAAAVTRSGTGGTPCRSDCRSSCSAGPGPGRRGRRGRRGWARWRRLSTRRHRGSSPAPRSEPRSGVTGPTGRAAPRPARPRPAVPAPSPRPPRADPKCRRALLRWGRCPRRARARHSAGQQLRGSRPPAHTTVCRTPPSHCVTRGGGTGEGGEGGHRWHRGEQVGSNGGERHTLQTANRSYTAAKKQRRRQWAGGCQRAPPRGPRFPNSGGNCKSRILVRRPL